MEELVELVFAKRNHPNDELFAVLNWEVESGDKVDQGQCLGEAESQKGTFELFSSSEGYFFPLVELGEKIAFLKPIGVISPRGDFNPAQLAISQSNIGQNPRATKKALLRMNQWGLSLNDFDTEQRVNEAMVLERINQLNHNQKARKINESSHQKSENMNYTGWAATLPLSSVSYHLNKNEISLGEYDIGDHICFHIKGLLENFHFLKRFYKNGELFEYEACHIGYVFGDEEKGFIVPTIFEKNLDDLKSVALEIRRLSMGYMRGELSSKDCLGGAFSISNLSSYDGDSVKSLPNHEQGSILSIIQNEKRYILTLTFDHRCLSGPYALKVLKSLTESIKAFS